MSKTERGTADVATWNQELAAVLLAARKRKRMTRPELAGSAGLSVHTLRGYEAGKRCPELPFLFRLAVLLELDLNKIAQKSLAWTAKGRKSARQKRKVDLRQLMLPHAD